MKFAGEDIVIDSANSVLEQELRAGSAKLMQAELCGG